MSKKWFKKTIAVLMAATMFVTMAGCNKKEGTKSETEVKDTKEMVYEASDFTVEGIEGEISQMFVQNEKLYITTYGYSESDLSFLKDKIDYGEEDVKEDLDASEKESAKESDVSEEVAEEESEASEETAEEESNASKETDEEEIDAFDESDEEKQASEEESEDDESEDGMDDIDFDSLSDEELEAYYEAMENATVMRLYSVNIDGTGAQEIVAPATEEDQSLQSMTVGKDGSMAFLMYSYDMGKEETTYQIVKTDAQGKEMAREDITKMLKSSEDNYISKIMLDDNGRIIVPMDQTIVIIDENITAADEVKPEGDAYMQGAALTKDGRVVCGMSVWTEETSTTKLQVLDVDNKKWGEGYEIDVAYLSGSESLMSGVEYDVYYSDDSGIYGYNIADKKSTKLMDYVASNIISDNRRGIQPLTKDQFIGTIYNEDHKSSLVVYNNVDPSTITDKTVITFGAVWVDDTIKKQAIEFNKKSKEYQIEFIDYFNENDPITKMNADIAAGNAPDILSLTSLPYDQYLAKGMFEDLTPYFEQDEEVHTEDLLPSVYEAMKSEDGKLYYIAPSFSLATMIARTSDVGTGTGWTFDELKALLEEKGDSVRPFYSENKIGMLYSFVMNGLNDYVDWNTGECRFDSQDFKDLLKICNRGTVEEMEYNEDTPSMLSLIQEGKVLFVEGWISFDEVQVYRKMYGEDITYIGYPNEDKLGSYFQFDNQLAIYTKSEVKEGAWEFLRTFMTKEFQGKNGNIYNSPTRKDCMDMLIKAKMATEEYTDELGQEIYPFEGSWEWDDLEVEVEPLSQEEVDMYLNLINNTKKVGTSDGTMMEIIEEEAKAYFAGQNRLDETVKVIQNRVTTYVNENR